MNEFEYGADDLDVPDLEIDGVNADEIAEAELARQQEQEERDAAASEAPLDPHALEREELHGIDLVWWHDDSFFAALNAMGAMFNGLLTDIDKARALIAEGAPESMMVTQQRLDWITGPMVVVGLQLLGIYVPELRDEIAKLLKNFEYAVATEEEVEILMSAATRMEEKARAKIKAAVEAARAAAERMQGEQDAWLGIDPN